MHRLSVTSLGRAVAKSALLPRSAAFFLAYFRRNLHSLLRLLDREDFQALDEVERREAFERLDEDLSYVLFHLCYSSPEFGDDSSGARRFLPYPVGDRRESERAERLQEYLVVNPWDRNMLAANAADISTDWILGTPLGELEGRFFRLRGGMVRDMLRTAASHLGGVADILGAGKGGGNASEKGAASWPGRSERRQLLRLVRRIYQYASQAVVGLPEDVLWMASVVDADGQNLIGRSLAMELRRRDIRRVEDLLDKGRTNVLMDVVGRDSQGRIHMGRLREAAERSRIERTSWCRERILKRLRNCERLVYGYFDSFGSEFEARLEKCFGCLGLTILSRDDGKNRKPRFPDFVVQMDDDTTVVIECKSSPVGKDIDLGGATEVGGKAALHGLSSNHLVTVCQRYVSSDVARQIESDANISVINAEDFGLGMAYLKSETVDRGRFIDWLTTPGQPRVEEMFQR